jgi:hypothetical protein
MKKISKETIERYNLRNVLSIREGQGRDKCVTESIKDRQYFDCVMNEHYKHVLNTLKEIGIKFVRVKILMLNSYYHIIYYNIAFIGNIEYTNKNVDNANWVRFNIKNTTLMSYQIIMHYNEFIKKIGRISSAV